MRKMISGSGLKQIVRFCKVNCTTVNTKPYANYCKNSYSVYSVIEKGVITLIIARDY